MEFEGPADRDRVEIALRERRPVELEDLINKALQKAERVADQCKHDVDAIKKEADELRETKEEVLQSKFELEKSLRATEAELAEANTAVEGWEALQAEMPAGWNVRSHQL